MIERQSETLVEQNVWQVLPVQPESDPFFIALAHKSIPSVAASLIVERKKKELEFCYILNTKADGTMSPPDLIQLWVACEKIMEEYGCKIMTVKPINKQINDLLEKFGAPSFEVKTKDGSVEHWKRLPLAQVQEIAQLLSRRLSR